MKPLDAFLGSINPYAPGCAIPTAHFAIRQAATEFCERTRLWRYEDEFDVSAADAEAITTPYGSVLLDIERVSFNGVPLEPRTVAWLDERMDGWRDGSLTGQPQFLTQIEPNTLRLVPGQEGTVAVSLWLKPSQDCLDLPDFLPDQFREVIAHGALGRILMMPNQPYTNGDLGAGFLASFEKKLEGLSGKGITGQQRARVRTKANFF
jgi:hypothetical protein